MNGAAKEDPVRDAACRGGVGPQKSLPYAHVIVEEHDEPVLQFVQGSVQGAAFVRLRMKLDLA